MVSERARGGIRRRWLRRGGAWLLAVGLLGHLGGAPALATAASEARSGAIAWLERNQNRDGSWGEEERRWVTTSEALLALEKAGRGSALPARRAKAWLLSHEPPGTDSRARAIRALATAGVDVTARAEALAAEAATTGWGPVGKLGVNSADTALALGGLRTANVTPTSYSAKRNEVLGRRRSDGGWAADFVDPEPASDRTLTAEIVRALRSL